VTAAIRGGAAVSVTVSLVPRVRAAIATIGEDTWTPIAYREAVFDPDSGRWISRAEVAEVPFTAFVSRPQQDQVEGRLVVRRIPDLNPGLGGQQPLFDSWRFHAFFTISDLDTITADRVHRGHAIIEHGKGEVDRSRELRGAEFHCAGRRAQREVGELVVQVKRAVHAGRHLRATGGPSSSLQLLARHGTVSVTWPAARSTCRALRLSRSPLLSTGRTRGGKWSWFKLDRAL
jgi:hypothetical protein